MPRALTCVFAHPDDETFSCGGMLAHYAAQGVRLSLYCATDGDAGRSSGIPVASREELGRLRRRELHEAAALLGLSTVHSAGHPDGALGSVDADQLIGEIVRVLREQRPQVVVSFGPEGAPTGHRDHKVISRAATAAFFLAGLPTSYPEQVAEGLAPWRPARLFYVSWPVPAPDEELPMQAVPATARIAVAAYDALRRRAFHAHATQRQHEARFEQLGMRPEEWFALAAGAPQPEPTIADLFAGL